MFLLLANMLGTASGQVTLANQIFRPRARSLGCPGTTCYGTTNSQEKSVLGLVFLLEGGWVGGAPTRTTHTYIRVCASCSKNTYNPNTHIHTHLHVLRTQGWRGLHRDEPTDTPPIHPPIHPHTHTRAHTHTGLEGLALVRAHCKAVLGDGMSCGLG